MSISGFILSWLIATQVQVQGDIRTRADIRFAAKDSISLTWFRTSASLIFIPVTNEKIDTRLGLTVRTAGFPRLTTAAGLTDPGQLEPVNILLDEVFVRLYDIVPGLTFTAGRQLVHWGTADAVNPTDNFTTPDYSDPLVWDERASGLDGAFRLYTHLCAGFLSLGVKPVF